MPGLYVHGVDPDRRPDPAEYDDRESVTECGYCGELAVTAGTCLACHTSQDFPSHCPNCGAPADATCSDDRGRVWTIGGGCTRREAR